MIFWTMYQYNGKEKQLYSFCSSKYVIFLLKRNAAYEVCISIVIYQYLHYLYKLHKKIISSVILKNNMKYILSMHLIFNKQRKFYAVCIIVKKNTIFLLYFIENIG